MALFNGFYLSVIVPHIVRPAWRFATKTVSNSLFCPRSNLRSLTISYILSPIAQSLSSLSFIAFTYAAIISSRDRLIWMCFNNRASVLAREIRLHFPFRNFHIALGSRKYIMDRLHISEKFSSNTDIVRPFFISYLFYSLDSICSSNFSSPHTTFHCPFPRGMISSFFYQNMVIKRGRRLYFEPVLL